MTNTELARELRRLRDSPWYGDSLIEASLEAPPSDPDTKNYSPLRAFLRSMSSSRRMSRAFGEGERSTDRRPRNWKILACTWLLALATILVVTATGWYLVSSTPSPSLSVERSATAPGADSKGSRSPASQRAGSATGTRWEKLTWYEKYSIVQRPAYDRLLLPLA
jgi:hypothetical protein